MERRTDRTNGHRQVEDDNAYDGDDVVGDNNDDERGAWKEEQIRPMGIARSEMMLITMMVMLLVIIMMMKEVRGKKNRSGQ